MARLDQGVTCLLTKVRKGIGSFENILSRPAENEEIQAVKLEGATVDKRSSKVDDLVVLDIIDQVGGGVEVKIISWGKIRSGIFVPASQRPAVD